MVELLKHFKSAKRVANAKLDELEDVVGASRAEKIYTHYHGNT
jgi:excinuclease ABC subunit C